MCKCTSVLDENRSASLPIKSVLQTPVLSQTIKIKAADLRRLYVCVHTMSQMEIKKSPCSTDLCNCKSLVTFYAFSFALSVSQRSCQVLSKETFSKDITGSELLVKTSVSISEMAGREQLILQQRIIAVPEFC